jgi:hypothetical protein
VPAIRGIQSSFLAMLVVFGSIRVAGARVWSAMITASGRGATASDSHGIVHGRVVRLTRGMDPGYALEVTGWFPFVRVIAVSRALTRMPIQVPAEVAIPGDAFELSSLSALCDGTQDDNDVDLYQADLVSGCSSCSSCSACGDCDSCTSCGACHVPIPPMA